MNPSVEVVKQCDIRYPGEYDSARALDLYLPSLDIAESSKRPAVFVHGGAWITSKKSEFEYMGYALASRGIPTVIAGYRLSPAQGIIDPKLCHPMHFEDISSAVAWVLSKEAVVCLGFTPAYIVLIGHSAGAHLTGLLALKSINCATPTKTRLDQTASIRGVIGIEGIYSLSDLAKTFPTYVPWFIERAFMRDPLLWDKASPKEVAISMLSEKSHIADVTLPRYLLIHSPEDELVNMEQTNDYAAALQSINVDVEVCINISGSHDDILKNPELHDRLAKFISSLEF
ncbi:hypothetical protein BATDEDRAFT_35154 [Batrachochytrium dendrobatidis JAM81]|uniref:Kynurenine formamidase n=1 Tax=Batrachochytrium dendrobatidis (strain JAM81 / FGSC 10211) TaxID=684364 RepID=F4P301_BATDJ|nr:uncharacterized protein BATDEDRAFT_35154 [Batrachochytrium dendrobatidis JAM81]EGF80526.1 hypothetical protein BATDEDRAFT_35154 [Batrachochytrium dendrobatidis JAM81]KAK5665970.1 hypothetical protein QVD99_007589 [Batrachochytrium dendrobatidis]|eukprot:XP_006679123.1 hypothetical protein BATDEDRAFT_35154 [Batrachochytrium dendrobatidis JAM81]